MSDESAVEQIAKENKRRHAHNVDEHTPRCKSCGGYTSKPEPENGQLRYQCSACESWVLEWVKGTQKAKSD